MLLEQNTVPGRATRLLSRFARVACLSFEQSAKYLSRRCPIEVTGNPVRREFILLDRDGTGGPSQGLKKLLVLGGSQGSRAVNDLVLKLVSMSADVLTGWQVIHQTGESDFERVSAAYQEFDANPLEPTDEQSTVIAEAFIDDMPKALLSADLIVARAGATTLAEVACSGIPAVLVPYPNSIHDHQLHNAKHYTDHSGAVVFEQHQDRHDFLSTIESLLTDETRRTEMGRRMQALARPDATQLVSEVVEQITAE